MSHGQLLRLRWAVRGVLALGVVASTIANVLHANPHPVSQTIAAWPPLALLLTVELISRVPVHRMWLAVARFVATAAISGIAAWVSYWHMVGVAQRYGETGAAPYLIPLSVDGLVVVASVCLVELGGRIAAEVPPVDGPVTTTVDVGLPDPFDGLLDVEPGHVRDPRDYAELIGPDTPPAAGSVEPVGSNPSAPAGLFDAPPPRRPAARGRRRGAAAAAVAKVLQERPDMSPKEIAAAADVSERHARRLVGTGVTG